MKTIIAGSRDFSDYNTLKERVDEFRKDHEITHIISGTARGADMLGERYAKENGIELISMPANWNKYGKSAGYRRNEEMANIADACICFWDGESRGTSHMIDIAKDKDLELLIVT